MIGELVGSYRISRKLGEGGMGVVYLAEHAQIGRKAAVKLLLPEFSNHPEIVTRFFNEARATSLIDHPGLVQIYDFGYHASGSAFIVMEFISGESLAARITRERVVHTDLAIAIARQVAGALGAAHAAGIVHRDLKPDNVMLVPDRDVAGGYRAKVLDFGIAKLAGDSNPQAHRTRTGAVMGTPGYMSPEQCRGAGEVDARSDIYALGCMLFAMATGREPFVGEGPGDVIAAHLREPPPSPRAFNPDTSPELEAIILRSLAKLASDRQQTMAELIAELDTVPPAAYPRPPTAGEAPTMRVASPVSTTLGASVGQITPPPQSPAPPAASKRVPVMAGAGVAVALGAAVAVAVATHSGGGAAPVTTPTIDAGVVARHMPAPDAAPAVAPAATVKVHIESDPPGAAVAIIDGASRRALGVAPLDAELPAAREVDVEMSLAGYRTEKTAFDPDRGLTSIAVPLAREEDPKLKITIGSTPSGAIVFDAGGHRRGVTPYHAEIDRAGGPRAFELRCIGYQNGRVQVSAIHPTVAVKLLRDVSVPPASECD